MLVDLDDDPRTWFWGTVYADGELVISASPEVDEAREVLAHGNACCEAVYRLASGLPWSDAASFTTATVAEDMAALGPLNMCYWFYAYSKLASFSGLGNLAGGRNMAFAFASGGGVTEIDLRGFDPSGITNLQYTFSGCSALTTIYVDDDWALPSSGISGSQTFYNCKSLVGGNGTAWTSSNTGYKYCVIDAAGSPGYLTG